MTRTQTFVSASALLAALPFGGVNAQLLQPHADLTLPETAANKITMLHSTIPMKDARDVAFGKALDKEAASSTWGVK